MILVMNLYMFRYYTSACQSLSYSLIGGRGGGGGWLVMGIFFSGPHNTGGGGDVGIYIPNSSVLISYEHGASFPERSRLVHGVILDGSRGCSWRTSKVWMKFVFHSLRRLTIVLAVNLSSWKTMPVIMGLQTLSWPFLLNFLWVFPNLTVLVWFSIVLALFSTMLNDPMIVKGILNVCKMCADCS